MSAIRGLQATNHSPIEDPEVVEILLVDDRPENLLSLEAVLSSPGYKLVKASSGKDALRYLLDNECAVILMDVQMPEMDGFETASVIKQSPRSREIPIIFVTAISVESRFVHRGYEYGAVDYIFKPFEPSILRSKVAVFADLYRKTRQVRRQAEQLREAEAHKHERELAQLQLASLKRETAAHQRYKELVEDLEHAIVWAAEPDSLMPTYLSPAAGKILGFDVSALEGDAVSTLERIPSADRARFVKKARSLSKPGDSFTLEHRLTNQKGELVWFQTAMRLASRLDGKGLEIRGLSVDVSALKAAESALRIAEKRQRFLAEASRLLTSTLKGEEAFEKLAALCLFEIADAVVAHTYDVQGNRKTLVFSKLKKVQDKELEGLSADSATPNGVGPFVALPLIWRDRSLGSIVLARSASAAPFDASELEMLQDLASRTSAALETIELFQKAQEANLSKNAFLANVSHEIRTPLGAVLGFAELMASQALSSAERQNYLDRIKRASFQLTRLIEEVLDLSKIEAGRIEIEKINFKLRDILDDVMLMLTPQAQSKRLELDLMIDSKVPTSLHSDPTRLKQILVNMLGNAIKFTHHGKIQIKVSFEAKAKNPHLKFSVSDTGIGIEESAARKLFQPFTQADVSTTRKYGGTGLGLALSRRLARALGGDLTLTQSAPGKGSCFTLTIDPGEVGWEQNLTSSSNDKSTAPTGTGTGTPASSRLRGLRVLLIEDSQDNQFLVSTYLRNEGAEVQIAGDGIEGCKLALANPPDLVLMDIQMPELDGFGATIELRKHGFSPPIIALTAHAFLEERERCLKAGCNDHISKPVVRELLIEKILFHTCRTKKTDKNEKSAGLASETGRHS